MNNQFEQLVDFSNCPISSEEGFYGGKAGIKRGVIYQDSNWLIKFPTNTKQMRNVELSYTTAPLSEYIGSHIYQILDIPVHETIMGTYKGKLVVGCKDFLKPTDRLAEYATLRNVYVESLQGTKEELSSSTDNLTEMNEIMIQLKTNPILTKVSNLENHFWTMVIVDGLINNNDRNATNWGIIRSLNGSSHCAPVYDNGGSFYNKLSDQALEKRFHSDETILSSALNTVTAFKKENKQLQFRDLVSLEYAGLQQTLNTLVPKIESKFEQITSFINQLPEKVDDVVLISPVRKAYYIQTMKLRLEHILLNAMKAH